MRFLQYLLLGILAVVTPYVLTIILIIITGDRYEGMALAVMPGLISVQLIFGLIFIKRPLPIKIPLTLLLSAVVYGVFIMITNSQLIKTSFDIYGFWDLAVTNSIAGIIIWEIFYHVDSAVRKRG